LWCSAGSAVSEQPAPIFVKVETVSRTKIQETSKILVHSMKGYRGVAVGLHSFLTLTLDGGKR